ncbi:MAG: GNAT family N-acetyltransferase [Actinomycetota bacterium]
MGVGAPVPALHGPPPPPGARFVDDPEELIEHYSDRPDAHVYALVDLGEPYWSASRWYRRDDAVVGVIGLPGGEGLAVYAVATVDPHGTLDLVAELAPALPSGLLVTGPVGLGDRLARVRPVAWHGPHERYVLATTELATTELAGPDAESSDDEWTVEPLVRADLARLDELYSRSPGAVFFLPSMLDDGAFVGVHRRGDPVRRLVAAAGTHVLSDRHGVAALGAVFTDPTMRGLGLGRRATIGAIHRVLDPGRPRPITTVGLNVAADNTIARRLYESLRFDAVHTYAEAELA